MRRLLAAGACAVALAGCAPSDPPADPPATSDGAPRTSEDPTTEPSTPVVAGPAVPTGADAVAADDLFVAGLRAGSVDFADPETMVILGRGICAELQQGAPVIAEVDAVTTGSGGKWDQGAAGAIVGSAIGAYCPEFRALLPN
ncbi:DUF732 domain-containing protein [Rhodococcoides kroppenstedtii]|uniref:DUF732 domain-containing protein n=1 Tax=Rhodococcoides kroppenstedtii TaxID=293050 RepID=UPI00202E414F|nr:DUF732 domain-containing protein [Rhodococcus kroppenstedtii]